MLQIRGDLTIPFLVHDDNITATGIHILKDKTQGLHLGIHEFAVCGPAEDMTFITKHGSIKRCPARHPCGGLMLAWGSSAGKMGPEHFGCLREL